MLWVIRTCFPESMHLDKFTAEGKRIKISLLFETVKGWSYIVHAHPVVIPFLACPLLSTARDRTPGHLAALTKPFSRNKPA